MFSIVYCPAQIKKHLLVSCPPPVAGAKKEITPGHFTWEGEVLTNEPTAVKMSMGIFMWTLQTLF